MKVLFLPTSYPSAEHPVSWIYVKEHARAARLYDDVGVLYGEPTPAQDGFYQCWFAEEDGLPTWRFRFRGALVPKTWLPLYYALVFRAFRRVLKEWGRPDVIHTAEPGAALAAWLINKVYGIPYVVSEHWTAFSLRTLNPGQAWLARRAYPQAARVLGDNSKFPADFDYFSIKTDFRWVPNCVDLSNFYPPIRQSRELMVLHCSFMDKKKRALDLIRGFARCQAMVPEARLEVVGDGEDRLAAENLARQLLIPDSCIFHGLQTLPELADCMRRAKVFALPSAAENLPCVLINAMACGTPVVTTPVGDIERIVGSQQGILHQPGDIEGMAQALKAVLTGERVFDSQKIAAYAHRHFSLEAVGQILHQEHERAARLK